MVFRRSANVDFCRKLRLLQKPLPACKFLLLCNTLHHPLVFNFFKPTVIKKVKSTKKLPSLWTLLFSLFRPYNGMLTKVQARSFFAWILATFPSPFYKQWHLNICQQTSFFSFASLLSCRDTLINPSSHLVKSFTLKTARVPFFLRLYRKSGLYSCVLYGVISPITLNSLSNS